MKEAQPMEKTVLESNSATPPAPGGNAAPEVRHAASRTA